MNKILLTSFVSFTLLTSCVQTKYFQLYNVNTQENLSKKDNSIIFEDNNCKISYNLWSEGGNIGFKFYNKTEHNIYINLEESFYILNEHSYNYYKNRIFSNNINTGISGTKSSSTINTAQTFKIATTSAIGLTTSTGYSVSYNEEKIVCVPSKTFKIFNEYKINESIVRDCDLLKYPNKRNVSTKKYSYKESPLVFSNRISYKLSNSEKNINIENQFFVSEISNIPENKMYEYKYDKFCDEKSSLKEPFFRDFAEDKFYIRYDKIKDSWKH